jgi:murein DD-endopeptidase MepM/ murein hydrolase activator NlpD
MLLGKFDYVLHEFRYKQRSSVTGNMHGGQDCRPTNGNGIHSFTDGTVTQVNSNYSSPYGSYVRVKDNLGNTILYGHFDSIDVRVGQKVNKDTKLGTMGNSRDGMRHARVNYGIMSKHLHFQVEYGGGNSKGIPV